MKKLLALVLALVMTLSLCVTSNAAYKDAADVNYDEAVDVMTAIGVFNGTDGKFNPDGILTREQAAKIVTYMLLGKTAADALVTIAAPFADVAADRWSAGSIAYCYNEGILAGVGEGKFAPTAQLTGLAFAKMMLTALGYNAANEGLTGSNWSINAAKLALTVGLTDDLDDVSLAAPMTREQAAQMALNALQANMVEYPNSSVVKVGDIEVSTSATAAVVKSNNAKKYDGKADSEMQFCEKYFSNLKKAPDTDAFMRPATTWTNKSTKIGTYVDEADLTYTAGVKNGALYSDLGLSKKIAAADIDVYVDGAAADSTIDIAKGGKTTMAGTANGVLTEVFYDDVANTAIITMVNTYVGDIAKSVAATASKDAYIVVNTDGVRNAEASGTEEFETDEKFEDDAVVYYTFSEKEDAIQSVAVCEIVEGAVTQVINKATDTDQNNGLTIAGTAYKTSAKNSGIKLGEVSVKNDYIAYLDGNGYVIYVEEAKFVSSNYALVLGTAAANTFVGYKAQLLFTDGTVKVVDTAKNYNAGANAIADNTIVTFKVDDGKYVLKAVTDANGNDATETNVGTDTDTFAMVNGKAGIVIETTSNPDTVVTANSNTAFVVYYADDAENSAYTGIKNAPTITAGAGTDDDVAVYYYCKTGSMVTVMFIAPDADIVVEDDTMKSLYLASASKSNLKHDADGDYFEYNAIVNGEIKTVKVDANANLVGGVMNKTYSVDKHGVITKGTAFTAYNGTNGNTTTLVNGLTGISKTSADYTVTLGNTYTITVADGAKIYYVDTNGKITESSYKGIVADNDDLVYAVVDDWMVEYLVIVEDGGVVATTYDVAASTDMKFCKTVDGTYTATLLNLAPGTTVFVKTDAVQDAVKSTAVTLTEVQAPTSAKEGIYSFVITADVAAEALTKVDLVKVTKSTATVVASGVTFTATAPATDLYVEAGTLVDITVTVSGVANGTTAATLTVTGATAMTAPVASDDAVVGTMAAAATSATTVKFTPVDHEYYNATYTFKAVVGTAMSFALA